MPTNITGWFDVTDQPPGNADAQIAGALMDMATSYPNGAVLYFPAGTYSLTVPVNIPKGVTVMGSGTGASVLVSTVATNAILALVPGDNQIKIVDIALEYEGDLSPQVGGYAIHATRNKGVQIRNVAINNPYIGLLIDGGGGTTGDHCSNVHVEGLQVTCAAGANAGVSLTNADNPGNHIDVTLTDCYLLGSTSAQYGFDLENCQATVLLSCFVSGFEYGMNMRPRTAVSPWSRSFNQYIANCAFQGSAKSACAIGPTVGNIGSAVYDVQFVGCTFSGSDGPGVSIEGVSGQGNNSGIRFSGCSIRGNDQQGVTMNLADTVQISGSAMYGNGGGTYNALDLTNAPYVSVAANIFTGTGGGYPRTQNYAIKVGAGCTNVGIFGCDLSYNLQAIPLEYTTGIGSLAAANLGYNPQGVVAHPALGTATNTYPSTVLIYLSGSATAVSIDSVALTTLPPNGAPLRLGPNQTITVAGASNWQWFLE